LLGYVSRTCVVPAKNLTISVLTNAADGFAWALLDGALHVAHALAQRRAPSDAVKEWTGRWWTAWGAIDLLPTGDRVLVAMPGYLNPVMEASEIEVTGPDKGRVVLAAGYGDYGESVHFVRDETGAAVELWTGGTRGAPEAVVAKELRELYGAA
jgi:hypothetical protein